MKEQQLIKLIKQGEGRRLEFKKERDRIIESLNSNSMIAWKHVNIHGEYDFGLLGDNETAFNIKELMQFELSKHLS